MNAKGWIGLIVIIIIIIAGWWLYSSMHAPASVPPTTGVATTTPVTTTSFGQTTSDGTIVFALPSDFGLATTPAQVLVKSYIPSCEDGFNYCLYYNGTAYTGTNFESAGLSITKRADLATEQSCLSTPPQGYDASIGPNASTTEADYSTSVFRNVGDAGAGHFASGILSRLFVKSNSSCYEFLSRVGQTQFANYPAGTINQFTDAMQAQVNQELLDTLDNITLAGGEKITFAQ